MWQCIAHVVRNEMQDVAFGFDIRGFDGQCFADAARVVQLFHFEIVMWEALRNGEAVGYKSFNRRKVTANSSSDVAKVEPNVEDDVLNSHARVVLWEQGKGYVALKGCSS